MSAEYPGAIWTPSPNCDVGRGNHLPLAIVDHIAQGFGLDRYFATPSAGVSATFSVTRMGVVRQHVRIGDTAWTNGIDFDRGYDAYLSDLSVPWLKMCWDHKLNPNRLTISIEHEGFSGEPFPRAQIEASLDLHAWLVAARRIKPHPDYIVGHNRIDSVNRAHCPGRTFFWDELWAIFARPTNTKRNDTVANKDALDALNNAFTPALQAVWDAKVLGALTVGKALELAFPNQWQDLKESYEAVLAAARK